MDIGNIYGQIDKYDTLVPSNAYLLISILLLTSLIVIGWLIQTRKNVYLFNKQKIAILYLVMSCLYSVNIFSTTYEDVYVDKLAKTEEYTPESDIELYADLENNVINVIKIDNNYYFYNGNNLSPLNKNFFENRMMELK